MRQPMNWFLGATLLAVTIGGCGSSDSQQADTRIAANTHESYPPPETSLTVQRQGLRTAGDSEAVKKAQPSTTRDETYAESKSTSEPRRRKKREVRPTDEPDDRTPTLVEPRDARPSGWDDNNEDPIRRIVNGLNRSEMQNLLQGRLTTREVARRIRYNGSEQKLQEAIKEIQRGSSNRWRD